MACCSAAPRLTRRSPAWPRRLRRGHPTRHLPARRHRRPPEPRLGPPSRSGRPLPRARVGVGEPRLLGLGVVRGRHRAPLGGEVVLLDTGVGGQPVPEHQRELLTRPAVDTNVDVGRSARIGGAVKSLAPHG